MSARTILRRIGIVAAVWLAFELALTVALMIVAPEWVHAMSAQLASCVAR